MRLLPDLQKYVMNQVFCVGPAVQDPLRKPQQQRRIKVIQLRQCVGVALRHGVDQLRLSAAIYSGRGLS